MPLFGFNKLSRKFQSKSQIEVVLHLGVHKTATTYLQTRLARSVVPLLERKVLFVPRGDLRDTIYRVRNERSLLNFFPVTRDWRMAGIFRKNLEEAERAGCRRLIISEENILGGIHHMVQSGLPYPDLDKKLPPVFKGLDGHPVTVLLAVRSYDSWMSGMWSQFIRQNGYHKMDEQAKARLLAIPRGWVDVIDDVIRLLPRGSKLRVWCYEDFIKMHDEIISLFVGSENVSCVDLIDRNPLQSLTVQAMKRLENLEARGMPTGPADVKRVGKKFSKSKGFESYTPWTEEERAFLVTRYEKDMATIRERWPELIILAPSDACNS